MRKFAIAVALSSTVIATPALARNGAWYVGGDFGAMIVEDINFDIGATKNAATVDFDYGGDGDINVGYDFGMFRLEAEGAYKTADVDSIQSTIDLPGSFGRDFDPAGGGKASALSFMINGMLDFGDDDGVSGFVGGGAGWARVKFSNVRTFENVPAFLDDKDSGFAWQLFAGVRTAVSRNVDVSLKYRFFNVDSLKMAGLAGTPLAVRDVDARFRSHSAQNAG